MLIPSGWQSIQWVQNGELVFLMVISCNHEGKTFSLTVYQFDWMLRCRSHCRNVLFIYFISDVRLEMDKRHKYCLSCANGTRPQLKMLSYHLTTVVHCSFMSTDRSILVVDWGEKCFCHMYPAQGHALVETDWPVWVMRKVSHLSKSYLWLEDSCLICYWVHQLVGTNVGRLNNDDNVPTESLRIKILACWNWPWPIARTTHNQSARLLDNIFSNFANITKRSDFYIMLLSISD